jgi:hypothetical protein
VIQIVQHASPSLAVAAVRLPFLLVLFIHNSNPFSK